jgi:solute carrier family 25 S-adenosylmethionine transporter 26
MSTERTRREFATSLLAGSVAGTSVDVVLFPIDTLKTRMQSAEGFWKSGGFKGVYRGISAAAAGSAPGAALFFGTYTLANAELHQLSPSTPDPIIHMAAASTGEVAACIVRVPTEIVKQRMQTGRYSSASVAVRDIMSTSGVRGFFRGFVSTLAREIPFALIQFPLYERLKLNYAAATGQPCKPWESAAMGSVAGGIAAAITTPLDVAKTRIMLGSDPGVRAHAPPLHLCARCMRLEIFIPIPHPSPIGANPTYILNWHHR